MKPKLHSPAAHTLIECLKELKFGRPSEQQLLLDELANRVYEKLGNDGLPFSPEIIGEVFNKGDDASDKMIIHDKCGLPVELCECPDAPVKYNSKTDKFDDVDAMNFDTGSKPAMTYREVVIMMCKNHPEKLADIFEKLKEKPSFCKEPKCEEAADYAFCHKHMKLFVEDMRSDD